MNKRATPYLMRAVVTAAFGGLLFGYDEGVMSGALNFIGHSIKLSSALEGFVSGGIPLGAVFGCLIAGWLADKLGRKLIMSISAVLFILSTVGCGAATVAPVLIGFRLFGGVGIGMVSTLAPLYIAEISPKNIRGKYVGSYQLAIATGVFIVYIINALIANTHTLAWNEDIGWRLMFYAGTIPGIIFFILLFFIPESPRFLISNGKANQAKGILEKISSETSENIKKEFDSIQETVAIENKSKSMWAELFKKGVRASLIIAVLCSIFQQFTGTNAIGYYAPIIFRDAGAGVNASLIETIFIGLVKVIFVAFFMGLIDRLGRKRLLTWGGFGMAICMFLLAICFDQSPISKAFDFFIVALTIIHTIFYELSWGGGTWVLISELFPNKIRARASSIASAFLWLATYVVTQLFPIMLTSVGSVWTFSIFGFFCVVMGLFIHVVFRETAGKSLEQIQRDAA